MGIRIICLVAFFFSASTSLLIGQPNPGRGRAMPQYRLGLDQMRSERWSEAAASFERSIAIDPTFELAYYGLGRALMPQKKFAEAAAAYVKCRDLYVGQTGRQFSNNQEAQRYRRDQMTELDEVIRSYQQGPQTMQILQALRQLEVRKQQLQISLQRGVNLSIETTVPAFVSLALGSAYFRLQQLTDAEREYKAAIAADSHTGEAYNNLAVVYLETGRVDEAEKAVKAAEKTGFKVSPMLKDDIKAKRSGR